MNIPSMYLALLENQHLLKADGLTQFELDKLHELHSEVVNLCRDLASCGIHEHLIIVIFMTIIFLLIKVI